MPCCTQDDFRRHSHKESYCTTACLASKSRNSCSSFVPSHLQEGRGCNERPCAEYSVCGGKAAARAWIVSFSFRRLLCGSVQMKPASTSFVCNHSHT